jgi:hypothetical protein
MVQDEDLTEAWCIVKDLWRHFVVDVHRRGGQIEIVVDVRLMPQVRPGQPAPILEVLERTYLAPTWEDAIRAAGKGEGVSAAKIEDRIATAQRARREGRNPNFIPMDG